MSKRKLRDLLRYVKQWEGEELQFSAEEQKAVLKGLRLLKREK